MLSASCAETSKGQEVPDPGAFGLEPAKVLRLQSCDLRYCIYAPVPYRVGGGVYSLAHDVNNCRRCPTLMFRGSPFSGGKCA